jgi:hypothetical protein
LPVARDLQRTVAIRMREMGVTHGNAKMTLKHVEIDMTARYDKHNRPQKRRAMGI